MSPEISGDEILLKLRTCMQFGGSSRLKCLSICFLPPDMPVARDYTPTMSSKSKASPFLFILNTPTGLLVTS